MKRSSYRIKYFKTQRGAENFMRLNRAFNPRVLLAVRNRIGLDFRDHWHVVAFIERSELGVCEVPLSDLTPANRAIARQRLAAKV